MVFVGPSARFLNSCVFVHLLCHHACMCVGSHGMQKHFEERVHAFGRKFGNTADERRALKPLSHPNAKGDQNWLAVNCHVNAPGLEWQYPRLMKMREVCQSCMHDRYLVLRFVFARLGAFVVDLCNLVSRSLVQGSGLVGETGSTTYKPAFVWFCPWCLKRTCRTLSSRSSCDLNAFDD